MSIKRLEIRETDHFAYQVYEYFQRETPGSLDQLSRKDFITLELNPAKEVLATRFFELEELIPGRNEYRVYTVAGVYVPLYSIYAQLVPNKKLVELIELEVDFNPPEAFNLDPNEI